MLTAYYSFHLSTVHTMDNTSFNLIAKEFKHQLEILANQSQHLLEVESICFENPDTSVSHPHFHVLLKVDPKGLLNIKNTNIERTFITSINTKLKELDKDFKSSHQGRGELSDLKKDIKDYGLGILKPINPRTILNELIGEAKRNCLPLIKQLIPTVNKFWVNYTGDKGFYNKELDYSTCKVSDTCTNKNQCLNYCHRFYDEFGLLIPLPRCNNYIKEIPTEEHLLKTREYIERDKVTLKRKELFFTTYQVSDTL